jgi:hypothetical protein
MHQHRFMVSLPQAKLYRVLKSGCGTTVVKNPLKSGCLFDPIRKDPPPRGTQCSIPVPLPFEQNVIGKMGRIVGSE